MAYESGCKGSPRVNIFSTPDKTYADKPQGTETTNNARVLNEAMVSGCRAFTPLAQQQR